MKAAKRAKPLAISSTVPCKECDKEAQTLYEIVYLYEDRAKERRKETLYIKCPCGYSYQAECVVLQKEAVESED